MGAAIMLLMTAINFSAVSSELVGWFPGDYFNGRPRTALQREVLENWPGPTELVRLWNEGNLSEEERVILLVGGAAFHDPQLLAVYRQAVISDSQRIRQAAIYGYRDLLADGLPNVNVEIDDRSASLLGEEMRWVERTLRKSSMVEMWLQAVLSTEDKEFPGWRGIRLQRSVSNCYRAIERLVEIEDLDFLVNCYRLTDNRSTRINLIKLIEAVTLSRFIIMPSGGKQGWGAHVFDDAMGSLEHSLRQWSKGRCAVDGETALRHNLKIMGVPEIDPLARENCRLWVNVLEKGLPQWWMMASRKLYACGGPWYGLTAFSPENQRNKEMRQQLLSAWRSK